MRNFAGTDYIDFLLGDRQLLDFVFMYYLQHLDVVKMFCMEKHKGSFRQTWHGEYYNPLLHLACKVGALSIIR